MEHLKTDETIEVGQTVTREMIEDLRDSAAALRSMGRDKLADALRVLAERLASELAIELAEVWPLPVEIPQLWARPLLSQVSTPDSMRTELWLG